MVSTDGSRGDDEREEGSPDESVFPPGPRRSTYTPPQGAADTVPGTPDAASAPEAVEPEPVAPDASPEAVVDPPSTPRIPSDLPAFVPPPPPAPDFEFLKPETAPVNVVYQLDDIQPELPFGVNVETLASSPAGARILPKEPPASPSEPEPIVMRAAPVPEPEPEIAVVDEPERAVPDEAPAAFDLPFSEPSSAAAVDETTEPEVSDEPARDVDDARDDETAADESGTDDSGTDESGTDESGAHESGAHESGIEQPGTEENRDDIGRPVFAIPEFEPPAADTSEADEPLADATTDPDPAADSDTDGSGEQPVAYNLDDSVQGDDSASGVEGADESPIDDGVIEDAPADEQVDIDRPVFEIPDFEPPVSDESAAEAADDEVAFESAEPEPARSWLPAYDEQPSGEQASVDDSFKQPLSEEPLTVEPITVEPITVEPAYVDPQFVEDASVQPDDDSFYPEPAYEQPAYEQPAYEEPTYEEPTYEEPAQTTDQDDRDAPSEPDETTVEPVAPLSEAEQLAALSQQGAPAGRPWIPERKSLKDEELSSLLSNAMDQPNGTLGVMEELERQLQLRDEETREFQDWQESMLAVGTPEAIAAVEKVLPDFTDIIPADTVDAITTATTSIPTQVAPPPPVQSPIQPPPTMDAAAPVTSSIPLAGAMPPPPPMGAPSSAAPPPVFTAPPVAPEPEVPPAPEPEQEPELRDDEPEPEPELERASEPVPADAAEPDESPIVFHEAYTDESREALLNAPPPLVEPPRAPVQPEPWAYAAPPLPFESEIDPEATVEPELIEDTITPTSDAPIFIDPVPVAPETPALVEPSAFGTFVDPVYTGPLTGSVSVSTGSISIPADELDSDIEEPLDELDQASLAAVFGASPATAPVLVTRVPEDEDVLREPELQRPRVFALEAAGVEPTPEEQRVGRAARMFWLWFAANASVASIAFGGIVFSLGLSLRQSIVAVLAGVAISFLPLGLGTLAGKRSGQPTMVVSRAAFGLSGNVVPAAIAVLSRVFWGSALLWILGQGVASVLVGAGVNGPLGRDVIVYLVVAIGLALALVFAVFGYGLIVILQLVSSIASGILIIGIIALTWQHVDIGVALTHPDGPWMLAGTAAVLVFSFIGLLWANSSGDLARYQRPGSSSPGSMLSTAFGATIPTFVLISYGALLAASDETIAAGLVSDPFDTIGQLLPLWYPAPLIAAIVLGLLSAVVLSIYSGGFALTALGVRLSRVRSALVIGALVALGAVGFIVLAVDYTMLFRDLATTLAVPVAAWAGIFAADTMIRQRPYDSEALLARGGIYPAFNWVNLSALVVIVVVGFGLTTASVAGLTWQGYLFPLLGLPIDGAAAGTDLGVIVALVLGLLVPIAAGIPGIRKQEATARRSG